MHNATWRPHSTPPHPRLPLASPRLASPDISQAQNSNLRSPPPPISKLRHHLSAPMVKLASARESRLYGGRLVRNRFEFINAGLYAFATIILLSGFVSQLSRDPKSGLVLIMTGLVLVFAVNVHDLVAHLAAIDYRFGLMGFDLQLALVEFSVPFVQALGSLLSFLGILFLLLQEEKGYGYFKVEKHALNLLIAGPVLWVLGSIHNSCQIYESSDGHVQILQQSIHIPFLTGSVLFMVASILNRHEQTEFAHGLDLLGMNWVWLGMFGSLLLFIGGMMNLVKVFKMQHMDGLRLEKLRGGAQERLNNDREGQVPFIIEDQHRRKRHVEETRPVVVPTPYKDVLLGHS